MSLAPAHKLATAADLVGLDPERAYEVLGGVVVEKAAPSPAHGLLQLALGGSLTERFSRRGSGDRPGGWWLMTEVEILVSTHDVLRPDLVGWRRDRVPERPSDWPVATRPDWVCEVLSPSTARRDLGHKQRLYHGHEVPWLWYADPVVQLVQCLSWQPDGYLIAATAEPGQVRELPPFEGAALVVSRFFGLETGEE